MPGLKDYYTFITLRKIKQEVEVLDDAYEWSSWWW
jgi:hypothetical protein